MPNKIDLQIQSAVSDGKYSPADLVRMAKSLGLETIAITDHDTIDGILEAWEEGKNQGIKVIPGIEMSCRFMEHGIHILGFGIDRRNLALISRLKEFQEERRKKTEKIVELLEKAGFKITFEDVKKEATGSTMARPHIALALLHNPENKEKLGPLNTVHEVIEEWLVTGKPTYLDRKEIEAKEAIELIHNAGGVAIWSHPTVSIRENFQRVEEVLKAFISYDIDGMETFHPDYSEDETEFLNTLAGKYGLLRSAGSDFHREPPPGGKTEGGKTPSSYQTKLF